MINEHLNVISCKTRIVWVCCWYRIELWTFCHVYAHNEFYLFSMRPPGCNLRLHQAIRWTQSRQSQKSFILAVLNHSAHTQLRRIQNRSISTHLDKKELLVYLFIVNVPFNSLMSAVLPLKALIVLPNKLILLVDRIFVNLQFLLLLCFLLLFWSTCRHSRWWWSKVQWQREPQPRTGRLKKQIFKTWE